MSQDKSRVQRALRTAIIVGCLVTSGGCYTADDIRARGELVEDPRVAEMERLWTALEDTLQAGGYTLKLNRPQDKIITTEWVAHNDALRRRVRMTLVVTNIGLGMNCTVQYQRRDGDRWILVEDDPVLAQGAKSEEQLIVRAAYARWTGEELAP